MIGTVAGRITFREFEQMPEAPGKRELLHGELIELPPPKINHNKARERLFLRTLAIVAEAHAAGKANEFGEVHIEMAIALGMTAGSSLTSALRTPASSPTAIII